LPGSHSEMPDDIGGIGQLKFLWEKGSKGNEKKKKTHDVKFQSLKKKKRFNTKGFKTLKKKRRWGEKPVLRGGWE